MKMHKILKISSLFLGNLLLLSNCTQSEDPEKLGDWYRKKYVTGFEGVARNAAVGVSADNGKGYVGLGYDNESERLKDFWEYDTLRRVWLQKADFPGTARNNAITFAIGNKVYMGLGYDDDYRKDFYEYNIDTDRWTKKADFGGSARSESIAFTIGSKGYVMGGFDDNYRQDLWEYDSNTDKWTQKTSFPGGKRKGAMAFVIDGIAYVGMGSANGIAENDLYAYNPVTDLWDEKDEDDSMDDNPRIYATAFVINGKGYLVGGTAGGSVLSNCFEYNPVSDSWTEKTAFEGAARQLAVGFSIGNKGYLGTGSGSGGRYDDFWGFDPNATKQDDN